MFCCFEPLKQHHFSGDNFGAVVLHPAHRGFLTLSPSGANCISDDIDSAFCRAQSQHGLANANMRLAACGHEDVIFWSSTKEFRNAHCIKCHFVNDASRVDGEFGHRRTEPLRVLLSEQNRDPEL